MLINIISIVGSTAHDVEILKMKWEIICEASLVRDV